LAVALSGLGALGITTAGIIARLKVVAGNLIGELHKLVTVELITANSLYLPKTSYGPGSSPTFSRFAP
jgi:hypothetical protein